MAYKFAAQESVAAGLRRVVSEQALKAEETAREGTSDPQAAIHSVRRRCKKIRAALRLARGSFRGYRQENAAVRDASRALGALRDRPVVLETYDALVDELDLTPEPAERERLALRLATNAVEDPVKLLLVFADSMGDLATRSRNWKLERQGFGALQKGLEITYRRMRRAQRRAARRPTAETLHDWRKLVKYHAHHLGLLGLSAPHVLLATRAAANDLADILGRHHDLDMLSAALGDDTLLTPVIAGRKGELEAQAFHLGTELSAEPVSAFLVRCEAYWDDWRAIGE